MVSMLLASSTEWAANTPKVTRCRSAIVAQIIKIRHQIDIPHKLVGSRIHTKEMLAKTARQKATAPSTPLKRSRREYGRVVEDCRGPAAEEYSQEHPKLPCPVLALREISDVEETFHLRYRIQCVDVNTSAWTWTLLSRGKLSLTDNLPPQFFEVDLVGGTLPDLVLSLTTPWTFLPQSSVSISGASRSNVLSSTIPTDVKGRDGKKKTACTLGTLLASVISPCPCPSTSKSKGNLCLTVFHSPATSLLHCCRSETERRFIFHELGPGHWYRLCGANQESSTRTRTHWI
jgi:hypothetical protein